MAKKYTNFYIFRFAVIMVIIVATILSLAAGYLKPFQDANEKTEKIQEILSAAGISSEKATALDIYKKYMIDELLIGLDGDTISLYDVKTESYVKGDLRAFDINMKKNVKALQNLDAGKENEFKGLPIYHLKDPSGTELYIIPVRGKGLWGPVWGNIAIQSDLITIYGSTFDHKGETPGLGAEINQDFFEEQFKGKKLFDEEGNFTSIIVKKGGISTMAEGDRIHGVDAITGGTITSNGVTSMLDFCLKRYENYFKNNQ